MINLLLSVGGCICVDLIFRICLYEGLSTDFFPEDLPVYPIINGALINSVPLKYLRQFPEHVATGFAFYSANMQVAAGELTCSSFAAEVSISYTGNAAPPVASSGSQMASQSHVSYSGYRPEQQMLNNEATNTTALNPPVLHSSEEPCWLFEDEEKRRHGPHSLAELYSFHHNGYLPDMLMVS